MSVSSAGKTDAVDLKSGGMTSETITDTIAAQKQQYITKRLHSASHWSNVSVVDLSGFPTGASDS